MIGSVNYWKDLAKWICKDHEEASGTEDNDTSTVKLEVLELLSVNVVDVGKLLNVLSCSRDHCPHKILINILTG